ncbi:MULTISPECIES: LacI family DNA-binding transcriptional regulator [Streptomyces]|uniref:LacI family DNA-binding transcriptional regulator n=2 Tax=Streptomyces chilikensis TaxID=1194079 RepID=A0ABV3EK21_9ACTN|nr:MULTISPECIES: LacI family DNA-binding transcriptional regulator [Streptomyces]MDH6223137.1 DNA-binding LacI/PurR family transcriptional regulator [Streptomyces sp. MJP52]
MIQIPDGSKAPTMADVARVAGVSHQTVSRVIGGHPNVSAKTRAAVTEVIEQLGYRRNSAARALATRRTHTLGVIAVNTTLHGPASTLAGVQEAARERGYLTSAVTLRAATQEALTEAVQHLAGWGVEGIVAITPWRDAVRALAALDAPCPVVTVEGGHDLDLPGVSLDQDLGARMVTEHLLTAGHSTVWHVAGPADWLESEARTAGWRAALRDAGVEEPPLLRGDWSPLSGYQAGQQLAGRVLASPGQGDGLTAVFVANDQMALGVLRAFREAGLHTPADVAVAGFDDIPEAEFFPPPLTTVRQDFASLGRSSIGLLLEHIEGTAEGTTHLTLAPELIVRASTARRRPAERPAAAG